MFARDATNLYRRSTWEDVPCTQTSTTHKTSLKSSNRETSGSGMGKKLRKAWRRSRSCTTGLNYSKGQVRSSQEKGRPRQEPRSRMSGTSMGRREREEVDRRGRGIEHKGNRKLRNSIKWSRFVQEIEKILHKIRPDEIDRWYTTQPKISRQLEKKRKVRLMNKIIPQL